MAKLEIKKSNVARLIKLNSSVEDFNLKTFISATETGMVKELGALNQESSYTKMRYNSSFQTVTKLHNYMKCAQVGSMSKSYLNSRMTWPAKGRSEDNALTIVFLAKYSAASMWTCSTPCNFVSMRMARRRTSIRRGPSCDLTFR